MLRVSPAGSLRGSKSPATAACPAIFAPGANICYHVRRPGGGGNRRGTRSGTDHSPPPAPVGRGPTRHRQQAPVGSLLGRCQAGGGCADGCFEATVLKSSPLVAPGHGPGATRRGSRSPPWCALPAGYRQPPGGRSRRNRLRRVQDLVEVREDQVDAGEHALGDPEERLHVPQAPGRVASPCHTPGRPGKPTETCPGRGGA